MEVFFSIIAGIFAIISGVFGVKNRIRNSRPGAGSDIRNSRARLDDLVSDNKRLERDKGSVEELDDRDVYNLRECARISERIRKREQEAGTTE